MRYCNPQMMQQISVVPTGAWAFCRLTLNNSQAIFRIRRASDNAELNIYSPSPAAIAAFCGASNGFVRSVFDQSGNGRHYDQTTNAQQLKIFDSATGTVLNLATGTTVGMLGDGSTTNMTGADSAGLTGNPAMTVSDLHEDTDATLNLGLYFFGKHQNAVGSDGYYAALPAGSVSNLTERLFGSVSLGTIFDVRFSGLITGLQSWVAHKPNAGTDTNFALTRNGVNLTQTIVGRAALARRRNRQRMERQPVQLACMGHNRVDGRRPCQPRVVAKRAAYQLGLHARVVVSLALMLAVLALKHSQKRPPGDDDEQRERKSLHSKPSESSIPSRRHHCTRPQQSRNGVSCQTGRGHPCAAANISAQTAE
jgi:hypothetical protein